MKQFTLLLLFACILFYSSSFTNATLGLDLSYFQGDVSQSSWNCLKQSGRQFAIIQAQLSTGRVNPYVVNDINRAKAAGIQYVDIYIFPNINQDPAAQVTTTLNYVRSNGGSFGQVWLDIEAPNLWSGNCNTNINFLRTMVQTIRNLGYTPQIYSSASQWNPIMCGSTEFSNMQLWYAHYDGNPSFSDFTPFGGWSHPNIKQYQGTTNICGTQIDQNFY